MPIVAYKGFDLWRSGFVNPDRAGEEKADDNINESTKDIRNGTHSNSYLPNRGRGGVSALGLSA